MKQFVFILALIVSVVSGAISASANTQRIKTRPDSQIKFDVSVSGPTRISVEGDRIAKVLQSESSFEMVNDEGTGDVFLRFAGGQAAKESGYIVTESGHTIGFVMTPKTELATQTVLVSLVGTASTKATSSSKQAGFAVNSTKAATSARTTVSRTVPANRTARLVQFTREAYARRIGLKSPARFGRGFHSSYAKGGMRARVGVASTVNGQIPSARSFYRSKKVLAVWIDSQIRNGKVWVIVVEGSL